MSRPEARPLLPQTTPMSNFSFAPPNMGFGDTKRNYVFVDEHNRHKRLKVMRACEGCRRRKIKCDAATTNSWPCAACVRLKLTCVPPTVNYNRAQMGMPQGSGFERVLDFADSSGDSGDESYMPQPLMRNVYQSPEMMPAQPSYTSGMMPFTSSPYQEQPEPHHMRYDSVTSAPISVPEGSYHSQGSFHHTTASGDSVHGLGTSGSWPRDEVSASSLHDAMGELKIDANGMAPYIVQQKKTLAEAPALDEVEFSLPTTITGSGATVRIPQELMPDEQQAMEYLNIFFMNIHPYVPVISKSYFYQQWQTNRGSISPLLLEAIFACAGRTSADPAQGAQWLALASKHETCFMDVPRLSTIQALLILLKAREANPKRGYYYRSWMTLKTVCAMAKDLELDEHYSAHQAGGTCSDPTECLVKTRIWQTIYIGEVMVGGPQGRHDMGTDPETVDFSIPQTPAGADEDEYEISRNFVYFVRAIRSVRSASDVYARIKKEKDWNMHPALASLNPLFPKWLEELPAEMQIHYPPDGSMPWIPNHYVGNIHCYYHLGILILHRPQLMAASFGMNDSWKQHMSVCYQSAKALCRVQEALFHNFGIEGFLYMQRGINFAIYCILTSTMLHLAAITSPDPEYNTDAKEYFTRHMRILERCNTAWPMAELQAQIQSLREAFSADISKPFEMKPSFPYASPTIGSAPSPPSDLRYDRTMTPQNAQDQASHLSYHPGPMTPPISAGLDEAKDGSMAATTLTIMAGGPRHSPVPGNHVAEDAWNPTRLFEYGAKSLAESSRVGRKIANPPRSQWATAFGSPQASTASGPGSLNHQNSPPLYSPTASTASHHDLPLPHDSMQQQQQYPVSSSMTPISQMQAPTSYSTTSHPYVSPAMWQDTVASTYVSNDLKRRWDGVGGPSWVGSSDQQQVKRPR